MTRGHRTGDDRESEVGGKVDSVRRGAGAVYQGYPRDKAQDFVARTDRMDCVNNATRNRGDVDFDVVVRIQGELELVFDRA